MRRNEIDAGSQPVRNLLTNPAFETVGARDMTIRTNHFTNPFMRTVSSTPATMRTNLITNSSMEASGGSVAVRSNLCVNPGAEYSTATTNVRTNLAVSPRGVSAVNPYSASAGTQTPNVAITGHPEGITTALRVAYTTQANVGISLLDVAEIGATYAMSIWVYHESVMSTPGLQAFAQAGVQSSSGTAPEVGKWVKLSWVWTATGTSNIGFRISSNSGTGNGSYLVTGMFIEKAPKLGPYFDGNTKTINMAPNPSFDVGLTYWGANTGNYIVYHDPAEGVSGLGSAKVVVGTASSGDINHYGRMSSVIPNEAYTASAWVKANASRDLRIKIDFRDAAGASVQITYTTTAVSTYWKRISVTATAPANAVSAFVRVGSDGVESVGFTYWVDDVLSEQGSIVNPYFDGTATSPEDYTYLWAGTANNSASIQQAPLAATYNPNTNGAKVWQTRMFSHNGTKSVVCESSSATMYNNGFNFGISNLPVGSYVFSAYVYLPAAFSATGVAASSFGSGTSVIRGSSVTTIGSWQRTSVKFTVSTVGTTYLYVITDAANGAPVGARFYADSFMVEAVPDISPYFDAANPRTNILTNPSYDTNTTGWGGAGAPIGVISRDTTVVRDRGPASLRVVCDGTAASQGTFTSTRPSVKPNRYYTASAWVRADAGKTMRMELGEWDEGANIIGSRSSGSNVVGTGDWVRVSATRLMGPNAYSADIVIRNANAIAHTFWVDDVLLEESDIVNDYYSGTGPFTYAWTGTANNSASEQRATSVNGIVWQGAIPPYQSSVRAYTGTKSLYLEGNPSDAALTIFAGPNVSGLTVGTNYTLSAWVYIMPGSVGLELQPSGVGAVASGRTSSTGKWERVYQTFSAASSSHTLRLRTTGNGKVQAFIDAMVLEQGVATNLPYFDGATPAYENIATGIATVGLSGASITDNVTYNGMLWRRATAVTGSGAVNARLNVPLNKLVDQQPYAVSVTVANDSSSSVTLNLDWCDINQVQYVLAPGETRRISTSGTRASNAAYDSLYRFADLQITQSPTEQKSILFKDWLVETGTTINNYYSGAGDYTYAWTGATDASTSVQRYYPVVGQAANRDTARIDSRFFGMASVDETGTKTAKWLSPAGTVNSGWRVAGIQGAGAIDYANIQSGKNYTLYIKYRASGWPSSISTAPVQFSDAGNNNQVMPSDTNRLNLLVSGWQTYRRTFTAAVNASSSTILYLNLPQTPDPVTDGILEVSEVMLLDNSYSGAYFDGSTVSTDPDFSYVWNGTPDASTSKMLGTSITGANGLITHGQGVSSSEWKSSGSKSLRLLAKNVNSNDSFVDLKPMVSGGTLKPNTTYTMAGTRYLKAPLTGSVNFATAFRVSINGERTITYKPGYSATNVSGAQRVVATFKTDDVGAGLAFLRIMNSAMENAGDVWWDDLMLVEGDYDGRHIDGDKSNAKWDGTAHASTSVGYPTTLEGLVGMPLILATTANNVTTLDSSKLASTSARTFYTVAESKPLSTGNIDVIWVYGQDNLTDSPSNKTLTFRYQSEAGGQSNSILTRRTGGAGAIRAGVPSPSTYIMVGGIDQNGYLFSGHPGSPTVATDNLIMDVPHERFRVEANNSTHTHIATYMFAGMHDAPTRALVYKLLAQRHNAPLLV